MAQYRTKNPYNAGFALPRNVMAEPPGRGTLTTAQRPRRTIDAAPSGWTGGYAVPGYIMDERPGRGARGTKQLPHGWATSSRVPDTLGALGEYVMGLGMTLPPITPILAPAIQAQLEAQAAANKKLPSWVIPAAIVGGLGIVALLVLK